MPDKITVTGHKELIMALGRVSTRTGTALSKAIKHGLDPVVDPMRAAVIAMVGRGDSKASTRHWSVSEHDFKERKLKNGKIIRTLSSAELLRAVKADKKMAGGARRHSQFLNDGSLAIVGKTGILARSIAVRAKAKRAVKVGNKRVSVGAAHGWVGPSNLPTMVAVSPWTGKLVQVVGSRYAHLVSNGHILKIRGKVVGRVPRRDFLRPVLQGQAKAIEARITEKLRAEIAAAAKAKGI